MGGDGDPVDVVVLGKPLDRGEQAKVIPIGILRITDYGKNDFKILAVLLNDYNILNKEKDQLFNNYIDEIERLKTWFENYKGKNIVKFINYGNSREAYDLVNLAAKEFNKMGIKSF